jgi:cytochrome b561
MPVSHAPAIKAAHWLTAALIAFAYTMAFAIDAAGSAGQLAWYLMLHRSAGIAIAFFTVVRLHIRARATLPPWPATLPRWQQRAAVASEKALYGLLMVQPALGLAGSLLRGNAVLFGFALPQLLPRDRALARQILAVHHGVGLCLLALIAVHIAAALHHHFVRGDDILLRMLPRTGRRLAAVRPPP